MKPLASALLAGFAVLAVAAGGGRATQGGAADPQTFSGFDPFDAADAAVLVFAAEAPRRDAVIAQTSPAKNVDDLLHGYVKPDPGTTVYVAPYKKNPEKKGDVSQPGTYVEVDRRFRGIFERMTNVAGLTIVDGKGYSDPSELSGRAGFIEYIKDSNVLNKGGKRATFGEFIKVTQGGKEVEYFSLFSYDRNFVDKVNFAAPHPGTIFFEVFVFGPFTRKDGKIEPDPPPLGLGIAVDGKGNVLSELPTSFAKVTNFVKEGHDDNEPVKGGVDKPDAGCFLCHGRDDQFPQSTLPFPWVAMTSPAPTETPTPTPAASTAPSPKQTGGNGSQSRIYSPPLAGPGDSMFASVIGPSGAGPEDVMVGVVDDQHHTTYERKRTDVLGKLWMAVPAAATAVEIFHRLDDKGEPDQGVQVTRIGNDPHLSNTDPLPAGRIPAHGPAITECQSSIGRGGVQNGLLTAHVRGIDPHNVRALLDGSDGHIAVRAASSNSVVAQVDDTTPLREYRVSLESGGARTNEVPADVIVLSRDAIGVMEVGVPVPVRVHVEGLPAGHSATMHFEVGGAAELVSGGTEADVPVVGGIATVTIRGLRSGGTLVRYRLHVKIAGFWE